MEKKYKRKDFKNKNLYKNKWNKVYIRRKLQTCKFTKQERFIRSRWQKSLYSSKVKEIKKKITLNVDLNVSGNWKIGVIEKE